MDPRDVGLRPVGRVLDTVVGPTSVDFVLQGGVVARVEVISDEIVRFRLNPEGSFTSRLTGAIAEHGLVPGAVDIVDAADITRIETPALHVIVEKSPYRVEVRRPDGSPVVVDDAQAVIFDPQAGLILTEKVAPSKVELSS